MVNFTAAVSDKSHSRIPRRIKAVLAFLAFFLGSTAAFADVVLFVSEPYGRLGFLAPTGHAAVYLPRVCAETPTLLRPCEPGETGVVISRYHRIAGYDWIAVPVTAYLYAVDDLSQVPASADRVAVHELRDAYRRQYLSELVPDETVRKKDFRGWVQLVGAAYDRRIYAFQFFSSVEQDDELIRTLNSGENRRRFNILYRNCADFARTMVNLYYPKAIRRSILADAAIMTPKQAAKSLVSYARKHPEINLTRWIIPQIPGSRSRSKPVRGVFESLVRSKKYVVPLAVFQPYAAGGAGAGYVFGGRFDPKRDAEILSSPLAVRAALGLDLDADESDAGTEGSNIN